MGVQVRTFCFQIPEVWFRQASGNSLLHQMAEQLGHFQRVSCIGRIEPGLKQGAVFIEKHLPVSAYGFAVFPRNIGIYGIKYHADSIVHIGKTTRLVSSVAKAMAGHPCVGFAGHLQKVTGMLRQPNCPFVLYVGTRKLVKRRAFEEYISGKVLI